MTAELIVAIAGAREWSLILLLTLFRYVCHEDYLYRTFVTVIFIAQFLWVGMLLYTLCADLLANAVKQSGATRIVDLCSGSGGPLPCVLNKMRAEYGLPLLRGVLTDIFPHPDAWDRLKKRAYLFTPGEGEGAVFFHRRSMFTLTMQVMLLASVMKQNQSMLRGHQNTFMDSEPYLHLSTTLMHTQAA